jgi:hypothetical protein
MIFSVSASLILIGINPSDADDKIPTFRVGKYKETPQLRTVSKKEIIIPGLSRFPGSKFISGQEKSVRNGQGTNYDITYSIPKASEAQVIPFYAQFLSSNGFKYPQQTQYSISAEDYKSGSSFSASVKAFDGFSSDIVIDYTIMSASQ